TNSLPSSRVSSTVALAISRSSLVVQPEKSGTEARWLRYSSRAMSAQHTGRPSAVPGRRAGPSAPGHGRRDARQPRVVSGSSDRNSRATLGSYVWRRGGGARPVAGRTGPERGASSCPPAALAAGRGGRTTHPRRRARGLDPPPGRRPRPARPGRDPAPRPPAAPRLTRLPVLGSGPVVARDGRPRAGWPGWSPGRTALDVHVLRLRRRLAPLGLAIRTVRSRGYLLERADGGGQVAPDVGRPLAARDRNGDSDAAPVG